MCGIFAVSGTNKNAGKAVLSGLKKLEYRGYDSWGIGIRTVSNKILIEKDIGKISQVNQKFPESMEAIGHSRWATHGGVTQKNAHPHRFGRVILVHNGIFENYEKEKILCKKFGAKFVSETDSEVIAAMIDDSLGKEGALTQNKIELVIAKVAKCIAGRFAILVMIDGFEGIFAAGLCEVLQGATSLSRGVIILSGTEELRCAAFQNQFPALYRRFLVTISLDWLEEGDIRMY